MSNAIKEIMRFQTDRALDTRDYQPEVEIVNILEELLESQFNYVDQREEAKELYKDAFTRLSDTSDDEKADAFCDVIVFAVGALMKLGYDPEHSLGEVAKEINSRIGSMQDGKFVKDKSPEAQANWYKAQFKQTLKETK